MPHVIIDYSADIDANHHFGAICSAIFDALIAHPSVPDPKALKIRARPSPHWHCGQSPQSFAHAELLVLPGRDDPTKAALQRIILDCLVAELGDVGSLSVDVAELNPTYVKRVL